MKKRILSTILVLAMMVSLVPASVFAADINSGAIRIEANSGTQTISITAVEPDDTNISGDLVLTGSTHSIDRDYSQSVIVGIENTSAVPVKYYLESDNQYNDIFMNFVKSGSVDEPLVILPGETQDIELSIFAQNATHSTYKIPVYAYIIKDAQTSQHSATTITLNCTLPTFNIGFTLDNTDPATLTKTYTVRNDGAESITDLTLVLAGETETYARISPSVYNYELGVGQTVTVKLVPDLSKMKVNSKTQITGELVAKSRGLSIPESIIFDTQGATITTTTMGDLALMQDGNPYFNMQIDENSMSTMVNGIDIQQITEELDQYSDKETFEELFDKIFDADNNYEMSLSQSVDFTYGNEGEVIHVDVEITSKALTNTTSNSLILMSISAGNSFYDFEPVTGTVTFSESKVLTFSEYEQFYADAFKELGSVTDIPGLIAKPFLGDTESDFEVTIKKTVVKETWKTLTKETVMDDVGKFSKGFKTASDIIKVDSVIMSPNYSDELKGWYAGLTTAKNVLRWAEGPTLVANPLAWAIVKLGDFCIDRMLGDLEDIMVISNGTALYYDIYGNQCTNVGKVTSNFYVPDYDSDNVEMYETGRMYGGSYVNSEETNYTYYLNGQRAGSMHNTGLTEVSIVKIPTDNLRPGSKNTIVRDYDTNPGTHFVTADSEITIIYPSDTEISYIGNPNTLEEVRLLPDFAVYSENIFVADDVIIGEANQISAHIYNRGSLGGWVDITITDGVTVLYSQENCFIDAFSSVKVSDIWTPTVANHNIMVTLVNKTIGIDERKTDNNAATHTFAARARQIPVIGDIGPTTTIQNSEMLFTADVTNIADIKTVRFVIDTTTYSGDAINIAKVSANEIRASVRVPMLTVGTHTVKAVVEYKTGKTTTAEVNKSQSVMVNELVGINFTMDATIVNPSFRIMRQSGWRLEDVNVSVKANGGNSYTLLQNSRMSANPNDYYLMVKCNAGLVWVPISTLSGSQLTLTDGKKVSITKGTATIDDLCVSGINGNWFYDGSVFFGTANEITFSTAITEVDFDLDFTVNLMDGYTYFNLTLDGNKTVNLSDHYKIYQFTLSDIPAGSSYLNPRLIYVREGSSYGRNAYPSRTFNSSTKQLSLLVSGIDTVDELNNAESVKMYLAYRDTLYVADVLNYSSPMTLGKSAHRKITYLLDGVGALDVQDTCIWLDDYSFYLYGNEIFVPAGSYEILTYYLVDTSKMHYYDDVDVSSNTTIKLPGKPVGELTTVSFAWPAIYAQAQMSYRLSGSVWSAEIPVEQLEQVIMPIGQQVVRLYLSNESQSKYAYMDIDISTEMRDGENTLIKIGDSFKGSVYTNRSSYDGKEQCRIYLEDLIDIDGNELTYYSSSYEGTLYGTVTLTNKLDPLDTYTSTLSASSLSSLYFTLPNVTGEYYYSVVLSTDKTEIEVTPNEYNIVASAETGGNISPSGIVKVTEGNKQTFTISATKGYVISDVLVDGVSVGSVNTYAFNNVTGHHTITAKFALAQNSSGGGGSGRITHAVTFETNGGSAVENQSVADKGTAIKPSNPTKEGYTFIGWYSDVTLTTEYDFAQEVIGNITLYAKWVEGMATPPTRWENQFNDVTASDWFYNDVKYAVENGLFKGITETTFEPNSPMTRAMIITVLARYAGVDTEVGEMWYSKAFEWGMANGITDGTNPNDNVTREQLAALLWRFAKQPEGTGDLSGFKDNATISDWAVDALNWANSIGLINGYPDGTLNPQGNATRAEVAAIVHRFIEATK